MRRFTLLAVSTALLAASPLGTMPARATTTCGNIDGPSRLLVLSAFPTELSGIMKATALDSVEPIRSPKPQSKEFWTGTLAGKPVIEALTGIGPVNAFDTTNAAFACFGDHISGVVFSGVAGGSPEARIGDVTIPDRWTMDGGITWSTADPDMLALAGTLQPTLTDKNNLGDPACVCTPSVISEIPIVQLPYHPRMLPVGGKGSTTDPFSGHAAPCLQHGGDLAGCEPCPATMGTSPDPERFATGMQQLTDPNFFLGFFAPPPPSNEHFIEGDEETAAVAQVANENGIPMIGFRAISDGPGDPLMLPGFPFQFAVYKQISADNAAATAIAFIAAWN